MMRGVSTWAVAVRKPSEAQVEAVKAGERIEVPEGEIEIVSEPLVSWTKRHRVYRLPIIRGVVALGESLKIGFKALGISANAQLTEDEKGEQQEIGGAAWAGHDRVLADPRDRAVLPAAGRPHQPLQGRDPELVRVRRDREAHPDLDLPRATCG